MLDDDLVAVYGDEVGTDFDGEANGLRDLGGREALLTSKRNVLEGVNGFEYER